MKKNAQAPIFAATLTLAALDKMATSAIHRALIYLPFEIDTDVRSRCLNLSPCFHFAGE